MPNLGSHCRFALLVPILLLLVVALGSSEARPAPKPTPVFVGPGTGATSSGWRRSESTRRSPATRPVAAPVSGGRTNTGTSDVQDDSAPASTSLDYCVVGARPGAAGYLVSGRALPAPVALKQDYVVRVLLYSGPGPLAVSCSQGMTVAGRTLAGEIPSAVPNGFASKLSRGGTNGAASELSSARGNGAASKLSSGGPNSSAGDQPSGGPNSVAGDQPSGGSNSAAGELPSGGPNGAASKLPSDGSGRNADVRGVGGSGRNADVHGAGAFGKSTGTLGGDTCSDTTSTGDEAECRAAAFRAGEAGREVEVVSQGSSLCVAGRSYRGKLHVFDDGRELVAVDYVALEDYLRGVVPKELLCSKIEAMKAQAVLARTYALAHRRGAGERYDVRDDSGHQVYGGVSAEHKLSDEAVAATAGLVLSYNGRLAGDAIYHSTCGGQTEGNAAVYGTAAVPYLQGVDCADGQGAASCGRSSYAQWMIEWEAGQMGKDLSAVLRKAVGPVGSLEVVERAPSGRVVRLLVHSQRGETFELRGDDMRRKLRWRNAEGRLCSLPSTRFAVEDTGESGVLRVRGSGWGHGLGMCQWGAIGMAEAGCSYLDILDRYYVGTRVVAVTGAASGL